MVFNVDPEGSWIQNRQKIGKVAYVCLKAWSGKLFVFNAGDGNRTHTPLAGPRILSPFEYPENWRI
jgi:hypothetical protein